MISRLADQKGFDLLMEILEELFALDIGFVLLGTGEQKYHDLLNRSLKNILRKPGFGLLMMTDWLIKLKREQTFSSCPLNMSRVASIKFIV